MENNIDYIFNSIAAKTIKKYREKLGYSLEEVVKKMKNPVSRQSLYKYENNLARMKTNVFIDICNALGINSSDIFKEINEITTKFAEQTHKDFNLPSLFLLRNPENGNIHGGLIIDNEEIETYETLRTKEEAIKEINAIINELPKLKENKDKIKKSLLNIIGSEMFTRDERNKMYDNLCKQENKNEKDDIFF